MDLTTAVAVFGVVLLTVEAVWLSQFWRRGRERRRNVNRLLADVSRLRREAARLRETYQHMAAELVGCLAALQAATACGDQRSAASLRREARERAAMCTLTAEEHHRVVRRARQLLDAADRELRSRPARTPTRPG